MKTLKKQEPILQKRSKLKYEKHYLTFKFFTSWHLTIVPQEFISKKL